MYGITFALTINSGGYICEEIIRSGIESVSNT